jgi:hypothetical protein
VGIRDVPGRVSTAAQDKLQPWQAMFAVFTYALTQFDIGQTNTIILLGMIITGLGFVQNSTYKHKQAIKDIVAPWAVEQAIHVLSEYLKPELPRPPEKIEKPVECEPTREEIEAKLRALKAEVK